MTLNGLKSAKLHQLQLLLSLTLTLMLGSCSLFQSAPVLPARHALVIGIADYQTVRDLSYTVDDALDMRTLLIDQGWNVESPLVNSAATKAGIRSTIQTFLASVPRGDYALIYYSGHGWEADDTSYIVPYDYDFSSDTKLISENELAEWFSNFAQTDNLIFIADSCYSGGFIPDSEVLDAVAQDYSAVSFSTQASFPFFALAHLLTLIQKNGSADGSLIPTVISASGSLEFSYEDGSLKHGVFTYYLMEASVSGDSNNDGYVTATEAYTYAVRKIASKWNNRHAAWDEDFHPHISGGLRDIVLFSINP